MNVIFDLDGTLVDSLPGIEESARVAIARVLPEEPVPELRALIGPPIATMFALAWPDLDQLRLEQLVSEFRKHYDAAGCLLSKPYPQVAETLAHLHQAGRRLFVLTNKPTAPAKKILAHLGWSAFFTEIMGPDAVSPPFHRKSDGARLLSQKHGLAPGSAILVGDGVDDGEAAAAGGFPFVVASYGYGKAADKKLFTPLATVKNISEIKQYLL